MAHRVGRTMVSILQIIVSCRELQSYSSQEKAALSKKMYLFSRFLSIVHLCSSNTSIQATQNSRSILEAPSLIGQGCLHPRCKAEIKFRHQSLRGHTTLLCSSATPRVMDLWRFVGRISYASIATKGQASNTMALLNNGSAANATP